MENISFLSSANPDTNSQIFKLAGIFFPTYHTFELVKKKRITELPRLDSWGD